MLLKVSLIWTFKWIEFEDPYFWFWRAWTLSGNWSLRTNACMFQCSNEKWLRGKSSPTIQFSRMRIEKTYMDRFEQSLKKEIFPALKYFSRLFSKNIQNGAEVAHNAQTDQNSAANGSINVHQLKVKVKKRTVPVSLWVLEFGLSGQIGLVVLLLTLMLVAILERCGSNNYF